MNTGEPSIIYLMSWSTLFQISSSAFEWKQSDASRLIVRPPTHLRPFSQWQTFCTSSVKSVWSIGWEDGGGFPFKCSERSLAANEKDHLLGCQSDQAPTPQGGGLLRPQGTTSCADSKDIWSTATQIWAFKLTFLKKMTKEEVWMSEKNKSKVLSPFLAIVSYWAATAYS